MVPRRNRKRYEDITMLDWYQPRQDMFPLLATLCTMAIYAAPFIMGVRLSFEPSVVYWLGRLGLALFAIPVLIMGAHLVYVCTGAPSPNSVAAALIVPAGLVTVTGFFHMVSFAPTIEMLNANDCTTSSRKAFLEEAWQSAAQHYDTCLQRVANTTQETVDNVAAVVYFDDCEEYSASSASDKYHEEWYYFQRMEHVELCAGWCTEGSKPLFMEDDVSRDTCSNAAALALSMYVKRVAWQMVVFGALAAGASAVFIHFWRKHSTKQLASDESSPLSPA